MGRLLVVPWEECLHCNEAVMQGAVTSIPWTTSLCRPSERLILGYFLYTAALAFFLNVRGTRFLVAMGCPVFLFLLAAAETQMGNRLTAFLRHWLPLSLILLGYYQVDLFLAPPLEGLQRTFIGWDRMVLNGWGVHAGVEALGPVIPWLLELVYLLLYAIPPIAMGAIYWNRRSSEADRFLLVFFAGTFAVYALLPHFPTLAPRVVYPDVAPPDYTGLWRRINLFNLTQLDIATSVFPSGHVAVAFSAAYGIWEVLPRRRGVCAVFFALAVLVYLATVYCRYHYVADGAASIVICTVTWAITRHFSRARTAAV